MLTIRSITDGRILGFAKDQEVAAQLAQANDWHNWYAVLDESPREFQLVQHEPDTDPRNRRGRMV